MSIASEITRLQNAKSALATSIGNKGVTVPASTKLDGYSALVDQIQTGGGGSDDEWHRPSNWPDYSKIPMSSIGTDEVYLTCDCRPAIAGGEPAGISFSATAPSGYTVERGYIGDNGFVAVASSSLSNNIPFQQCFPTDEGDFVVYRITSVGNINNFAFVNWNNYIGNKPLQTSSMLCLEVYGKLEHINAFNTTPSAIVSIILSFKPTSLHTFLTNRQRLVNIDTSLIDTSGVTTMASAFQGCILLKTIDVTGFDTSNVLAFTNMFAGCASLRRIIGVESMDAGKVISMQGTFSSLPVYGKLDISRWDLAKVNDTKNMFSGSSLTKIEFDSTLTVVNDTMFSNMAFCTTYIFHSTVPPSMSNVNAFNDINSDAKIYVPDASVNAYKTASNWSTYASYIYPISDLT